MKKTLLSLVLATGLLAEIVVIVNPSSGVDALDAGQVKKIFLAKTKKFPNGEHATPIDQKAEAEIYTTFYKAVANKNATKMNKYWVKLTFTGKGEAPKKVNSDAEVIDLIKNNKNMIGYVDSGSVSDGVKVVLKVN